MSRVERSDMTDRSRFSSFVSAACVAVIVGCFAAPSADAAVRAAVGRPLQAAIASANAGDYTAAMDDVRQAETVGGLTEEEQRVIGQVRDYIAAKSGHLGAPEASTAGAGGGNDFDNNAELPAVFAGQLYQSYAALLSQEAKWNPAERDANVAAWRQRWLTPQFIANFDALAARNDADPITGTQDYCESWITTMRANPVWSDSYTAIVSVTLGTEHHRVIAYLKKLDGHWRLDSDKTDDGPGGAPPCTAEGGGTDGGIPQAPPGGHYRGAALNHAAHVGMSRDDVRKTLGTPDSVQIIPPDDELWVYGSLRISFSKGKVTYVGQ
ncbi:MAG: DUF3828 domain-containing protein [Alphaproteobacteria bacterium]|nr:DUF3828 domain-containing protein [Alphaproteobacteria bacterium]